MKANLNRSDGFKSWKLGSIFLFFGLFLFSILSFAQNPEPVYRRYTVDDGLPTSTVYHIFQDSRGYIWFATANGVSRFDGYKFENFDLRSGLVDNDVFEIYEDYKHRIWFIPMSGKLCYFENDRIISYKYNSKIVENTQSSRGPIKCSFFVDSLDYVYISFKRVDRFCISPEGVIKRFENKDSDICITVKELKNKKILISSPYQPYGEYVEYHGLKRIDKLLIKDITGVKYTTHHHLFFLLAEDSSVYISLVHSIVNIKNGKIKAKRKYNEDIIWMSIDDDQNLWVALRGGGVQCYTNKNIEKTPQRIFLKNIKVTSVLKDREGAYWFSSRNDGVFYCSDINFVNYTKQNGLVNTRINTVDVNSEGAYIGDEFGYVDLLDKKGVMNYHLPNMKLNSSSVKSLLLDSLSNRVWVSSTVNLSWINSNVISKLGFTPSMSIINPQKVHKSRLKGYWIGSTKGIVKHEDDNVIYESYANNEFTGIVYDVVEDYDGVIWFCTINGLWRYSRGSFKCLGTDNPILANTSYSLIQNPIDSSLWIGTNGAGIVVKKKEKTFQITKEDGLISNSINQLYYTRNNIWVATRQGLSRIILSGRKIALKNYTKANGLPTNEVSSVCEYNNIVYVGTSKGLTVFDKEKITENITPPNIIISGFKVNAKQINLRNGIIDLNHYENSLNIDFVGFVYRNEGRVNYKYRMLGIDTTWVHTQTPNCIYNALTNGNYKFEVKAQSYNGIWSSMPASISFTIHPPFWKRTWFLVLGSIIFSCFIFMVYKVRINAIHRRNDLLQNINLYKQQSLRQQMNPHFIFNTLNSIQLYILEKDTISSHRYLSKFAQLMRMILDNSLNSTIPLRDEIEALKHYLDLERLRLDGRFEYSIDFGDNESILGYKIPTLLIQPFVENAIWHGISLKQDQMGCVKIILIDNKNTITCLIEDNGVGRKQAGEIRQMRNKEYKSRGSQIIQQRMELLSLMYKEQFNIYYDDLLDNQGNSLGTRVSIIIPKEIKVVCCS